MRTSGRGDATRPLCNVLGDARLIFVGGKGGVGKTTVSSAVALTIARRTPGGRVLVLSTDPAHSLGDVLAQTIGDVAAAVRGGPRNLHAREVDAAAAFAARRAGVEAALEEIAAAFGVPSGTRGMTELVDLAPPGIDELFGMLSVVDARAAYHTIVVDTAPTGHALRLLEMPDAAREWVQALLRVLLKYKDLMRPGQLASELVDLSKSVRRLQELLRDPARTRFIMVTRAAEVPRAETVRLMTRLKKLRLTTPAVVVNARRLAPGSCPWCRALAAQERREMKTIAAACRRAARDCAIIQAPLAAPPPRGVRALEAWARTWMT
jgi:arsenite-transporting ATPase